MRWIALLSGVLLLASPVHSASVLSIGDADSTCTGRVQNIQVQVNPFL